jgi:hypothetical protein
MWLAAIQCGYGIQNILATDLIAGSFLHVLLANVDFLPLFNDRRSIEMKTFSIFVCETFSYLEQVKVYVAAGVALKAISECVMNMLLVGSRRNVLETVGKDHIKPRFLHRLVCATRKLYGSNVFSEEPWIIQQCGSFLLR